jgi:hypothetical protein
LRAARVAPFFFADVSVFVSVIVDLLRMVSSGTILPDRHDAV